jgi:hypothetical protein
MTLPLSVYFHLGTMVVLLANTTRIEVSEVGCLRQASAYRTSIRAHFLNVDLTLKVSCHLEGRAVALSQSFPSSTHRSWSCFPGWEPRAEHHAAWYDPCGLRDAFLLLKFSERSGGTSP